MALQRNGSVARKLHNSVPLWSAAPSATRNSAGQPITFPLKVVPIPLRHGPGCGPSGAPARVPRLGYVLDGSLRVTNEDSGQSETFRAGDFVIESVA